MAGTATDRPLSVLTAAISTSALTAAAATSVLTVAISTAGGGYPVTYQTVYGPAPGGQLTAADQRAGGPG